MKKRNLILIGLALLILTAGSFPLFPGKKEPIVFPKWDEYLREWKKVDQQLHEGLTRSALEDIEEILERARQENNAVQVVKALMAKLQNQQHIDENATVNAINELMNETKRAQFPLKSILHSITADAIWSYYQRNRWRFQNRTETVGFKKEDISTWSLRELSEIAMQHSLASLKSTDSLQRVSINYFNPILTEDELAKEQNTRALRPTLYDLLAHRCIDFLSNSELEISNPALQFMLDDPAYFGETDDFIDLEITSKDSMSAQYHALVILQNLVRLHEEEERTDAVIDAEIKRLKFVKNNCILEDKETLYINALSTLLDEHKQLQASAEVSYELALAYRTRGNKYEPLVGGQFKWDKKKAAEICEKAIATHKESIGGKNCQHLLHRLEEKTFSLTLEEANVPDKPFRGLVKYQNVDRLYFRIIPHDYHAFRKKLNDQSYEEVMNMLAQRDPLQAWNIDLKDDGDFQTHAVETKLPKLSPGFYVILLSADNTFSKENNAVAYAICWVSNISYVTRKNYDKREVWVMDRSTGEPMAGVDIQVYQSYYDYGSRGNTRKKVGSYTTSQQGLATISYTESSRYFELEFSNGDDGLITGDSYYIYLPYMKDSKAIIRTHFYTDRAIYRPGQTVYFKGIVLESKDEDHKIKANYTTTVTFYDVNGQKISDMELTTNDYGSIQGSFTAPSGSLNGQMRIDNGHGRAYVQVEEYKRPKFEVDFEPIEGAFRLREKVKVVGKAKAYAGSAIDGATVKYRVVRSARFPSWGWYWWRPTPSAPSVEIKQGTIKTEADGSFTIEFTATPDLSILKDQKPTFSYEVSADVTDINGETRSGSTSVQVGYTAMEINLDISSEVDKNGAKEFALSTTNLAGQPVDAVVDVKVFPLKTPQQIFRKRKWEQPDRFLTDKDSWKNDFPNDLYANELDPTQWKQGEKLLSRQLNTASDEKLVIEKLKNWGMGNYKVVATSTDQYGSLVEKEIYFTLSDSKSKKMPDFSIDRFKVIKSDGEPGEEAEFLIGSAASDVKVLYEIEHRGKITSREWLTLNNEQRTLKIPIEEKHRGNFSVHFLFVKNGRVYDHSATVTVPHSDKKLDVEFSTFRNKLYPGSDEEWKVKIRGPKGEKVAAEMMATLYDASLDAFKKQSWSLDLYSQFYTRFRWDKDAGFGTEGSRIYTDSWNKHSPYQNKEYYQLDWYYSWGRLYKYEDYFGGNSYTWDDDKEIKFKSENGKAGTYSARALDNVAAEKVQVSAAVGVYSLDENEAQLDEVEADSVLLPIKKDKKEEVQVRTNFNETAFFLPQLETNAEGDVVIKFTIPESLTRWKFMGMAHTKDLKIGWLNGETVTQKELMVLPNVPRFYRVGDRMTLVSKISNLSESDQQGKATLELFDAISMNPIGDQLLVDKKNERSFEAPKGQSATVSWDIQIPEGVQAITYRIIAKAGKFSDGEEDMAPVLLNRMLVTESLPLPMSKKGGKTFTFDKLLASGKSSTLRQHQLTLEFTSNPAWYAVQALPYLMEYPYECSEQIFSRFYANSLASHIANSNPKITRVFDNWKNSSPEALLSNLEKNQELKALILKETPWVMDAGNESERKKRIALLFDLNRMGNELGLAVKKLEKAQVSNGGWPWFAGMRESRYITQHIVTGFGHLDHLGVEKIRKDPRIWNMVQKAVPYLDDRMREDYERLKRNKVNLVDHQPGGTAIQYFYARSYFKDIPVQKRNQEAIDYYKKQSKKHWLKNARYLQGMLALALHRDGEKELPNKIIRSLKENAIFSEEMGMYWKSANSYFWYQAPIESQALLIEAFDEISKDNASVEAMKLWLLKQKQTQDWKTTKATVEACYALLLRGTDMLANTELPQIKLGNQSIDPLQMDELKVEAGTGYFKKSWGEGSFEPDWGNVTIRKKEDGAAWGAVYWQYFEQLDKITTAETPLQLKKQLFIERTTSTGLKLEPLSSGEALKVGDKIKVRIELRVDRLMEYVHMKDMRASGFEPTNVLSGYQYQDGLGYYQSTGDAATNFFFDRLSKGTYVFEYPLRVTHAGDFSNGITSIQCMYAPEFTSHSEGVRVKVIK